LNAYAANDVTVVLIVLAGLLAALLAGFAIARLRSVGVARGTAWLLVVVGVVGFERLTSNQPPGFRMLAIIGMLLYCMKAVVAVETRASGKDNLGLLNWFGFAGLWVGMRPTVFARVPRGSRDGANALFWAGVKRLVLGALLVAVAWTIWVGTTESVPEASRRIAATAFLLPGLSLMLHFGAFNILAAIWRHLGADCRPLFRAPLLSRSLSEFWGQRWNQAFSEMTTIGVYRPLRTGLGTRTAMIVAFLFSGLLHELAISVPVKAGFGLPMLYFALHAVAMSIENRWERVGRPIHRQAWRGRLWTFAWIVIPLPILFHWPFLNGCVWPLIGMGTP